MIKQCHWDFPSDVALVLAALGGAVNIYDANEKQMVNLPIFDSGAAASDSLMSTNMKRKVSCRRREVYKVSPPGALFTSLYERSL